MSELYRKIGHKGQDPVVVIDAPDDLPTALEGTTVLRSFEGVERADFVLGFGTTLAQVQAFADAVAARTEGDAIVWFAYPKGSSKRYQCEFNRDNGWAAMGAAGFEPVRQVAVDADWSALRFRRVGFIKKMTRSFAMTDEGKARTGRG